jgi:hypothetical protein
MRHAAMSYTMGPGAARKLKLGRFLRRHPQVLGLIVLCMAVVGSAQQLQVGPMGFMQEAQPSLKVPKGVRAHLPRGAEVKLFQASQFNPEDTLVVYESRARAGLEEVFPFLHITYPTVVVLRANRIVARFKVRKPFTTDADWVFLSGGEFRLSQDRSAVAFAFRALGDGAGSMYLVLSSSHGKYQVLMNHEAGQARLRVLDGDGNLEIWEATYGDECVWCRHRYMIARYRWNGSSLVRASRRLSRGKPRPAVIAGRPLVMPQAPRNSPAHADADQVLKK